jgi:hypothetical protein
MVPILWIWCAFDAMGCAKLVNDKMNKDTTFGV